LDRKKTRQKAAEDGHQMPSWREVFLYFLFLGFVNVGGPVAQITMMYNHMVDKRKWLSKDRFVKIMAFCHMLPGPEALQLAIYVGYLKRKLLGGIVAGLTFIIPGAVVMIILSWLYISYGSLPQVNNFLYVLKPAVLGIIAAGIIKLGRASIRNWFLAMLLAGAFIAVLAGGSQISATVNVNLRYVGQRHDAAADAHEQPDQARHLADGRDVRKARRRKRLDVEWCEDGEPDDAR